MRLRKVKGWAGVFAVLIVAFMLPKAAIAEDCNALAASLARTAGGTVTTQSRDGAVSLTHAGTSEIDLVCPQSPLKLGVTKHAISVFSDQPTPPAVYFDYVANAGQFLFSVPASMIRSAASACLQQAVAASDGEGTTRLGPISFSCSGGPAFGGLSEISMEPAD